jgi:monothiol glutaredoxin
MSERPLLEPHLRAPAVNEHLAKFQTETLEQVREAIKKHSVVVVGMSQNPYVKNVRKALDAAGVPFTYLEYGSYFSAWKQRLAIKLWSGWPTFPQVFVNGILIGGETTTKEEIASGALKERLAVSTSA